MAGEDKKKLTGKQSQAKVVAESILTTPSVGLFQVTEHYFVKRDGNSDNFILVSQYPARSSDAGLFLHKSSLQDVALTLLELANNV